MDILKYEKIEATYNEWHPKLFDVANMLINYIETDEFDVIHIGSSSFKVGGKGIIDLTVLYQEGELNHVVNHLKQLGFQDQISDKPFPASRPRKDGAVVIDDQKYFIHVHAIVKNSEEHTLQLRYKNHMLNTPASRRAYEKSKQAILNNNITEQEAYGKLKSPFVKNILSQLNTLNNKM